MRRHKWKLLGALLAAWVTLIVAGDLFLLWPLAPPPVIGAGYDRVQEGMSQTEVADLLGGPPGDYRTWWTLTYRNLKVQAPEGGTVDQWQVDDKEITVYLDAEGRVLHKELDLVERAPVSVDSLLYRAKRQWRHLFR